MDRLPRRLRMHYPHGPRVSVANATSGHRSSAIYDRETGQIYTETGYTAPSTEDRLWQYQCTGLAKAGYRAGDGPPTLQDVALRTVVRNLPDVTVESLHDVPWRIGKKIWKVARAREQDSFYVWRTLASRYGNESGERTLLRRSEMILDPALSLGNYTTSLRSDSLTWITLLSISAPNAMRSELVDLCNMVNLVALDIQGPRAAVPWTAPAIDDRLIRSWSHSAAEQNGFRNLQVLVLRSQPDVTAQSLEHLSQFSSLLLYAVRDTAIHHQDTSFALQHGWRCSSGREPCTIGPQTEPSSDDWPSVLYRFYLRTQAMRDEQMEEKETNEAPAPASAPTSTSTSTSISTSTSTSTSTSASTSISDAKKTNAQSVPVLSFHLGPLFNPGSQVPQLTVFRRVQRPVFHADSGPSHPDAASKHPHDGQTEGGNGNGDPKAAGSRVKKRKVRESKQLAIEEILRQFGGKVVDI